MSYTFIHAADLHLDTPFSGLGQVAPQIQEALREASLEAFDALVELALGEEARFLLIAGDIYDGANHGIRAQHRFLSGLKRLSEQGIATILIHGNHDPQGGWSAIRNWPTGVTIFGDKQVEKVTLSKDGRPYATIHGVSFAKANASENPTQQFQRGLEPGIHIGLLHCSVGGCSEEHAAYNPCTLEDLKSSLMDYWALGHIHKSEILCRDPWVVYPGDIQGRSPKGSELGAKGAMVVRVESDRVREVTFAPLARIEFAFLDRDIANVPDLASLVGLMLEDAEELQGTMGGKGLILRARLKGRGPLAQELCLPGKLEELTNSLRQESPEGSSFIWWDEILDQYAGILDRETLRNQNDFSGELLRINEARHADPDRLTAFWEQQTAPLKVFKNLVPTLSESEKAQLIQEAEALALDLLNKE